jgi:ABC-2 type transport system permease protein
VKTISSAQFFRLMLWVHWRSTLAHIRTVRQKSRLLLAVLGTFMAGYFFVGYWLFYGGLNYLAHFPVVGTLLSQRILFLIFGFFFVMLAFSNLIIGYSTFFKNRETAWLLSSPVSHPNVYRWKFVESLAVSSWALIFLSAPMMAAFGRVQHVQPGFYLGVALASLPFVVIPALFGSWGILILVHFFSWRRAKNVILLVAGAALLALIFGLHPIAENETSTRQDVLSFEQLLRHTRPSLNPYLPSAWMAQSILAWSAGLVRQGGFFFFLLLSNALMGLLIGFTWVSDRFYESWSLAATSRAVSSQRRSEKNQRTREVSLLDTIGRALPFSRPVTALVLKDARLFWRDPAQWTQFLIFFGLLCIYVLNLRNMTVTTDSPFWSTLISYLNLTATALTLSTLTTRFVFPQFSLEGRRLWIIGLAPIGLPKILWQKFWLSCVVSSSITVSLMIISSTMLHLEIFRVVFFAAAIALMSATLCGAAVGLGALFPNMKEDNPSKIVSGFGGTLCLIVSFVYITLFVSLAALPALHRVTPLKFYAPDWVPLAAAFALSLGVLFFPLLAAMRHMKNLEF